MTDAAREDFKAILVATTDAKDPRPCLLLADTSTDVPMHLVKATEVVYLKNGDFLLPREVRSWKCQCGAVEIQFGVMEVKAP